MSKALALELDRPARRPHVAWGISLALGVATLLLTRHSQLPGLGGLVAPWALLILVLTLGRSTTMLALMPLLAYGSASVIGSALAGRDVADAMRFFIVLLATILAFNVRPRTISQPWALAPVALQCVLITALSVGLGVMQDPLVAGTVREMAIENAWGDVYSFDGIYYRVQVIGNALIPLLFMVCLWERKKRFFHKAGLLVSALGLVAAGNLTYFIVAALALALRYRSLLARQWLLLFLLIPLMAVSAIIFSGDAQEIIDRKFEGSDSSMGVRFDQVDAAQRSFENSPASLVFGAGLGARFPDGKERNYSEFLYIELQALYVTYQIGILGMLLYMLTVAWCVRRRLNMEGRSIFWLYMLSGITNPYILDTNQIVMTMLLVHLFPARTTPPAP
ncbi:hypothetical protein [uncultured Azohydromonas sp.]|uniref:O-antigen ligase family protein n=1 Tax=uncultured Azohydromonas sp. TaxID=487342 RepID=UPI00261FEED7|nr:hypothetical protein [uncultured Azohydromonas sp.]